MLSRVEVIYILCLGFITFSRLFFLIIFTYAGFCMSDAALDKHAIQIRANGNPGKDFDLEKDETGDLDFLRGLYPGFTNDEILELKERLDGYFDIALKVFMRNAN